MNRPNFIVAGAAGVMALAFQPAQAAIDFAQRPRYAGPVRMFEFGEGSPVVFAESAEEARELAMASGYDHVANMTPRLIPPNEPFTMLYDTVPSRFTADSPDCGCVTGDKDCMCEYGAPSVTLPAATWASESDNYAMKVIGEYD